MSPDNKTIDSLRIDRSTPKRSASWTWVILGVALLAAGLAFAGWKWSRPQALPVRTLVIRESSSSSGNRTVLNASGYVVARREATVSAKVTGKVTEVLVEEGMKVTEGQILARLDDSNTAASLRLAEAQLKAANSALEETKVRLNEAELELQRIARLTAEKVASQSELDRAKAQVDSLKARLVLQQFEADVAQRQAALWQQQMEDLIIRAPFTGVVTMKNAQPGEMISPISAGGGFTRTGICTIVDMNSLEIEVDVSESYINRVEEDQPVEAVLDAYSDWRIPARVIAIVPTADRQKATVRVRVGFEKLDPRILPQMGVKVAFHSAQVPPQEERAGITIPKSAVQSRANGGELVWVFKNGAVERRAITLGASQGEQAVVLAGLASGEKIILEPPAHLTDGQPVSEQKP